MQKQNSAADENLAKDIDVIDEQSEQIDESSFNNTDDDINDIENTEENFQENTEENTEESQIEELQCDDLELLKKENDSLKDNILRAQAEFQNFKRRTEKEKTDIYKFANERIVLELLGLMDNFDRAIESMPDNEDSQKSVLEGVEMMRKSLYELLQREGVQKIVALGEEFDPNLHHAVMTEEKQGCDSDIIIEEFQAGYKLGDKVIRPTMVKVSC